MTQSEDQGPKVSQRTRMAPTSVGLLRFPREVLIAAGTVTACSKLGTILSHDGAPRVVLGDHVAPPRRAGNRWRRRWRPAHRRFGTAAARRPWRRPAALARPCRRGGPIAAAAASVVLVVVRRARARRRPRRPRQRLRLRLGLGALARLLRRARAPRPALGRHRVRHRVRVWHHLDLWFGRRRLRLRVFRLGRRRLRLRFFWLGRRPDLDDGDLLDNPAGLAVDLLGELLAAELPAHNHLVELVLELHLLDAELLCSSITELDDSLVY
jgi:hypothetical protein